MSAVLKLLFLVLAFFGQSIIAIHIDSSPNQDALTSSVNESAHGSRFASTWESLDSRPLPFWYDNAKFGIFIHWGVFSVPSFGSEWFWKYWETGTVFSAYRKFMKQRYPPNFTYQDFAKDFTAEFYDPKEWSKVIEASGAKYVVLTSKHHEGYTMWPSKYSFGWNSMDVGPNRDLVGELAAAIRKNTNIKFGLYHSLFEWYNPLWLEDVKNNFKTSNFVNTKTIPELYELVELYKPDIVWSDGDAEAPDTYWKSTEFLAWLFNDSPVKDTVVVNDRWGWNTACTHGDFYSCADRYNPGVLQAHKWENAMTIDKKSWGYRRNAPLSDYLTIAELVRELVTTVSCGGNLLMNIGPTKDGIIPPIYEERLRDMGDWLSVNGEAIYNSKPWRVQKEKFNNNVWYTMSGDGSTVYASILSWPKFNILRLKAPKLSPTDRVFLLQRGKSIELKWKQLLLSVVITLPPEAHMGQPAWVIQFQESGDVFFED